MRPPRTTPLPLLVLAGVLLTGCGDGGSTVTAPSASATSSPTAAPTTSPTVAAVPSSDVDQTISLTYAKGEITGDTGRVPVRLGSKVRIVVTSDVAEELHLHVYDVVKPVTPGIPTELLFTADVPGQIELELHDARKALVRLVIS